MSKVHWLALMSVPGIGGATARRLVERLGSVEAVLDASAADLQSVPRISAEMAQAIRRVALGDSLEAIEVGLSSLLDEGIEVVTWDDDEYPANLRTISDAPPVLYVRGDLLQEWRTVTALMLYERFRKLPGTILLPMGQLSEAQQARLIEQE